MRETNYVEGEFPFRYLGVPLNEGKLNRGMFADLLNKMHKTLHNWANHKISYAGKISLINTVIFGLEQFWCSTLLIPKGVIKLITKLCRNFLSGTDEEHMKLIMKSWASCCTPHNEGGFNIKEVLAWNKCDKLKLHKVYNFIREPGRRISWVHAVWNKDVVPKHSFLVVLDMQHKLSTIDQLTHRVMYLVNRCVLCKAANEDHHHLFFQCSYSGHVWKQLLSWMGVTGRSVNLKKEIHWVASRRHRRHCKAHWASSCLNALTYSIWVE
ncbi:uncharacterized protein LOC141617633 [Silene latifolia]|uniref:uncharacterized protein LOC141617633 n=1 Tax=Silene latifolia TaxID=37657 RepID=UPI003D76E403